MLVPIQMYRSMCTPSLLTLFCMHYEVGKEKFIWILMPQWGYIYISFGIYKIGRIRKYLDRASTERLVHAFVSSHLDCNNSLLYGLPHNLLSSLQRVQNSAARLITGTKRREHISPILRDLHWLTVKDRIHFKILLLTYKAVHGYAPAYIRNLISFTTLKSLRSASQLALKPGPRSKTSSYGDRAFAVAAPKLWNNIPYNIRSASSIGQFKTQLKTFLFN